MNNKIIGIESRKPVIELHENLVIKNEIPKHNKSESFNNKIAVRIPYLRRSDKE